MFMYEDSRLRSLTLTGTMTVNYYAKLEHVDVVGPEFGGSYPPIININTPYYYYEPIPRAPRGVLRDVRIVPRGYSAVVIGVGMSRAWLFKDVAVVLSDTASPWANYVGLHSWGSDISIDGLTVAFAINPLYGPNPYMMGIQAIGGTLNVRNSTIDAPTGVSVSNGATVTIDSSQVNAVAAVTGENGGFGGGTVFVGGSKVIGSVSNTPPLSATCVASYNGSYVALSNTCQ